MLRGNGGQEVFLSEEDYYRLYLLVQEGTTRFRYRVHGFCCMTNHLHLLLQVSDIPLSRGMTNLSFRYTQWVNRRCNRRGHLFQGRFKALLVEADSYLLELVRYVHLNPVRCGMVRDPREYAWSSHRAYLGEEHLPWLTTDWVLGQLAHDRAEARRRYAHFVLDGLDEGYRKDFHQGAIDRRVLGDDRFLEQIADATVRSRSVRPTLEPVVAVVCRNYHVDEGGLAGASQQRRLTEARAMIAWLARETQAASLTEVGKRCHRDVGTMSSALRRLEQRARDDVGIRERWTRLKAELEKNLANLEA
jgi:REP element-mobilizing transposase RayT